MIGWTKQRVGKHKGDKDMKGAKGEKLFSPSYLRNGVRVII
jgi:hypothetical protein